MSAIITKRLRQAYIVIYLDTCFDCGIRGGISEHDIVMEYLFNLSLSSPIAEQNSRVLGLSWSRDNLLCVASSSVKGDLLYGELNRLMTALWVNIVAVSYTHAVTRWCVRLTSSTLTVRGRYTSKVL